MEHAAIEEATRRHIDWRIRVNPVYRFMQQQYVDAFFDDGSLRISTFDFFARHPDELRRDEHEGHGMVVHTNPTANAGEGLSVSGYFTSGSNAYVLCGSMACTDEMKDNYGTTGLIINNTSSFGVAVARCIPEVGFGWEGPCEYVKQRLTHDKTGRFTMADLQLGDGTDRISGDKLFQMLDGVGGSDDFLFKKPEQYFSEVEYRFAWITRDAVKGQLDIKCPEARAFCEPMKSDKSR